MHTQIHVERSQIVDGRSEKQRNAASVLEGSVESLPEGMEVERSPEDSKCKEHVEERKEEVLADDRKINLFLRDQPLELGKPVIEVWNSHIEQGQNCCWEERLNKGGQRRVCLERICELRPDLVNFICIPQTGQRSNRYKPEEG